MVFPDCGVVIRAEVIVPVVIGRIGIVLVHIASAVLTATAAPFSAAAIAARRIEIAIAIAHSELAIQCAGSSGVAVVVAVAIRPVTVRTIGIRAIGSHTGSSALAGTVVLEREARQAP